MATIQPVPDINPALPAFPGPNIPESQYDDQAYEWGTAIPAYGGRLKTLGDNVYNNAQAAAGILDLVNDAQRLTELARDTAMGVANFKGDWNTLSGSLARPATVQHNSSVWLLMRDVANVAAEVPGTSTAWVNQTARVASVNGGSGDVVVNWANIPGRNPAAANIDDTSLKSDVYTVAAGVAGTRPAGVAGAAILVVIANSNLISQRYIDPVTNSEWTRSKNGSANFTYWRRVAYQQETSVDISATSTVDLVRGNYFTWTVSGAVALSIEVAAANTEQAVSFAAAFVIEVAFNSGSISLPGNCRWPNGASPTLAAGKKHFLFFQREKLGAGYWLCSSVQGYAL